jgi:hypothetical protein
LQQKCGFFIVIAVVAGLTYLAAGVLGVVTF